MENTQLDEQTKDKKALPRWVIITVFAGLLAFLALIGWGLKTAQLP